MVFAFALLHAEHHVAVHLHEPAVAVPRKTRVVGSLGQSQNRLVVQTQVQNRVHHPRHRVAGTRTHRHQQREPGGVPELVAHDLFHVPHPGLHLALELGGIGLLVRVEIGADLGGDRESGRHWQPDPCHFSKVSPLAAQERLHRAVPVGLSGPPRVHVLAAFGGGFHCCCFLRRRLARSGGFDGFSRHAFRNDLAMVVWSVSRPGNQRAFLWMAATGDVSTFQARVTGGRERAVRYGTSSPQRKRFFGLTHPDPNTAPEFHHQPNSIPLHPSRTLNPCGTAAPP